MYYAASDKWRRLKRAYHRMEEVDTDTGNQISNRDAQDAAEDFFVLCYHFKDWLIKDKSVTVVSDIEDYINKSKGLSLAADICNSFKHAGLDRKSRSGMKIEAINTHIKIDLLPDKSRFVGSSRLEFTIDGQKRDAFAIVTLCMDEWQAFLKKDHVAFPDP